MVKYYCKYCNFRTIREYRLLNHNNEHKYKIITFYNRDYNLLTSFQPMKIFYGPCIFSEIKTNKRLLINSIDNDIKNINNLIKYYPKTEVIIFNYDSDNATSEEVSKLKNICRLFLNFNKEIKVVNNPFNHNIITSTPFTYQKFKNSKYINVPDFNFNLTDKIIEDKNSYPMIVSSKKQSGGIGKILIKDYNYKKFLKSKFFKNKFYAKYYESKLNIPELSKYNISIRLLIFNNILIDYIVNYSFDWCIHVSNSIYNEKITKQIDEYFENYFRENKNEIQNMINELFDNLGYGFYCNDYIFYNNKLILCELGYKIILRHRMNFFKKYNLGKKVFNNHKKLKSKYKKILLSILNEKNQFENINKFD